MPGNAADFIADPVGFMRGCVVIVTLNEMNPGKYWLKFDDYVANGTSVIGSQTGTAIPVYKLVKGTSGDNSFEAFWCPYGQSEVHACNLDNSADLVFTPQMDGCTLGLGSAADGCVRIAHANGAKFGRSEVGDARKAKAREYQAVMLATTISGPTQMVTPDVYQADHGDGAQVLKSTTFGVRQGHDDWQIYCQRYERRGNYRVFLRDIMQVI